jgi:hypothetical protein
MALSIRNPKVERLARDLSARSGLGMTEAIGDALEARLGYLTDDSERRFSLLAGIAAGCAAAPDLDMRSAQDILGYDSAGAFDGDRP